MSKSGDPFAHPLSEEICRRCGTQSASVQERYSFGVYAGILCHNCALKFRDHCGIDQPQGDPADLDEPYWEDE